jgi:hypothetical protein
MRKTWADTATGWTDLGHEVDRSRRCDTSFALLRFSAPTDRPNRRGLALGLNGHRPRATSQPRWIDALRTAVRSIDHVWTDDDHTYVVLCDTDTRGVKAFLARLESIAPDLVEHGELAASVFPDDGMTVAAIVKALDAPRERPRPTALHGH